MLSNKLAFLVVLIVVLSDCFRQVNGVLVQEQVLMAIAKKLEIPKCEQLIGNLERLTQAKLKVQIGSTLVGPAVQRFDCLKSFEKWNSVKSKVENKDKAMEALKNALIAIRRTDLLILLDKNDSPVVDFTDDDDTVEKNAVDYRTRLNWNIPLYDDLESTGIDFRYVAILVVIIAIILLHTYRFSMEITQAKDGRYNYQSGCAYYNYDAGSKQREMKTNNETGLNDIKNSDTESDDGEYDCEDDEDTAEHINVVNFSKSSRSKRSQVQDAQQCPLLHH